ncbi:hypothetical protein ACFL42_04750 [Candidatus Omnitrophota bacterium]
MRTKRILIYPVLLSVFLTATAYSLTIESKDKLVNETIAKRQPIWIGEKIYEKSDLEVGYQLYYIYLGYDAARLKIKYELYYQYDELEETETLTLPVGAANQAMLATKPLPLTGESPATTTRLIITVLDSYGRLKVEKDK